MNALTFGFKISAIGFSIVFFALIVISIALPLLRHLDEWINQSKSKKKRKLSSVDKTTSDEISPEIVAVISAAVAIAISKKYKIRRIQRRQRENIWSKQGRITHMISRSTRR